MFGSTHEHLVSNAIELTSSPMKEFLKLEEDTAIACCTFFDYFHSFYGIPMDNEIDPNQKKIPFHRYYYDEDSDKKGGLVGYLFQYIDGTINYIQDGDINDGIDWAGHLGMISHFIGDICTPVHVGSKLNKELIGISKNIHSKIERDMEKYSKSLSIQELPNPKTIDVSYDNIFSFGRNIYSKYYLNLKSIYSNNVVEAMCYEIYQLAVYTNTRIWNTMLLSTGVSESLENYINANEK